MLQYFNLNQTKFSKEIDISPSRLSNIIKLRNKPDSEVLVKIVTRFANVDAMWLLTGKGEMVNVKTDDETLESREAFHREKEESYKELYLTTKELLSDYRHSLQVQRERIIELEEKLNSQEA